MAESGYTVTATVAGDVVRCHVFDGTRIVGHHDVTREDFSSDCYAHLSETVRSVLNRQAHSITLHPAQDDVWWVTLAGVR